MKAVQYKAPRSYTIIHPDSNTYNYNYTSPGTYTISLPYNGNAYIEMVGGGGSAAEAINALTSQYTVPYYFLYARGAGGGGGSFAGTVYLTSGNYTAVVGSTNQGTFLYYPDGSVAIACYQGGAGSVGQNMGYWSIGYGGAGGGVDYSRVTVISVNSAATGSGNAGAGEGSTGAYPAGGYSRIGGWGHGDWQASGTTPNGYFRIDMSVTVDTSTTETITNYKYRTWLPYYNEYKAIIE